MDLAGHEKYLKTTVFGLTGNFPDYCMLLVGANMGVVGMTKEHFHLTLALKVQLTNPTHTSRRALNRLLTRRSPVVLGACLHRRDQDRYCATKCTREHAQDLVQDAQGAGLQEVALRHQERR